MTGIARLRAALWRGFTGWVARPGVSPVIMRIAMAVDRPLMRATRGRLRLSFVIPVLLLRVVGRRSGELRTAIERATPIDVIAGGRCVRVNARELAGEEREDAWRAALAVYPGYIQYRARSTREIPLLRLAPVTQPVPEHL